VASAQLASEFVAVVPRCNNGGKLAEGQAALSRRAARPRPTGEEKSLSEVELRTTAQANAGFSAESMSYTRKSAVRMDSWYIIPHEYFGACLHLN
jgi:hypothetical protein